MTFNSDEVNFLIYRYLQESGKLTTPSSNHYPLIMLVLQYQEVTKKIKVLLKSPTTLYNWFADSIQKILCLPTRTFVWCFVVGS